MNLLISFDLDLNVTDFPDVIPNFVNNYSDKCWVINRFTYLINTSHSISWWYKNLKNSPYPFIVIETSLSNYKGHLSDDKWEFLSIVEKIENSEKVLLNQIYNSENSLELIYEYVNGLCLRGKYESLDRFLHSIDLNRLNKEQMITLLSSTIPVRDKLSYRKEFFKKVKSKIEENDIRGLG